MSSPRIYPSLLAGDLSALSDEAHQLEKAGADGLHWDIMDGQFVPNLTFGPPVMSNLRSRTLLFFDVHLMCRNPENFIDPCTEAGAQCIYIHPESTPHPHKILVQIQKKGLLAGLALNPATPLSILDWVSDVIDRVMIMTVNPGFAGQAFIPEQYAKIEQLRSQHPALWIQVDGGVTHDNAPLLRTLGVNSLVVGTTIFRGGPSQYFNNIKSLQGL